MKNITVPNIKINYRLNEAKDYYGEIPCNIENRIKKGEKFDFVFEDLIEKQGDEIVNQNDLVWNDCKGVCYYFTTNEDAENILKKGFSCRKSETESIEKNFFFVTPKKNLFEYDSERIRKIIHLIICLNRLKLKGCDIQKFNFRVLKINLNEKYQGLINFYNSKSCLGYEDKEVFTYSTIPSKLIKDVTSEKLLNLIFQN